MHTHMLTATALALWTFALPAESHASDDEIIVEADIGLFFARLSAGITDIDLDLTGQSKTGVDRAIDSIGTGKGNVGQLRGRVQAYGHDLFFSYVSESIFDAGARRVVEDNVGNTLAQDALLLLAGELRPDMDDFLFDDMTPYVRVEFGRLEGVIDDPYRFATRNGDPWFPSRNGAKWRTNLLTLEAGSFGEDGDPESYEGRDGFGVFSRYTSFERPVVLGFGDNRGRGFAIQDGEMNMVAIGVRALMKTCDDTCWTVSGDFIPITGLVWLDLGPFGTQWGVPMAGSVDIRWSWPFTIGKLMVLEPYASFRADYMLPLIGNYFSAEINDANLWPPDYLLWGPSIGLNIEI
ncbi:MAG: hypothetical protein ACE366_03205 [Bradymonadia bacterium]